MYSLYKRKNHVYKNTYTKQNLKKVCIVYVCTILMSGSFCETPCIELLQKVTALARTQQDCPVTFFESQNAKFEAVVNCSRKDETKLVTYRNTHQIITRQRLLA